jgi:NUMOD4 motif/HNH endonuclease
MLTEFWKDVEGYEGLYQASSAGRVRNARGLILRLKQPSKTCRYASVCFQRGGVRTWFLVHRLVASAFVFCVDASKTQVNHLNGDISDNSAVNLEWCTPLENARHSRYVLGNKRKGNHVRAEFFDGSVKEWPSQRDAEIALLGKSTGIVSWSLKTGRPALSARWCRA